MRTLGFFAVIGAGLMGAAAAVACSSDSDTSTSSGFAAEGTGASSSGNASGGDTGAGGDLGFDGGTGDSALNPDSACATQRSEATLVKKPVDIIVVIDNSGSMTDEIAGVQDNIAVNFASIIESSGLDYRVILIARHGDEDAGQAVCIEAPLSGIPAGGCQPPPAQPINNPPTFFHYSLEIASHDSWCKVLDSFAAPDEFGLAPNGWSEWLRPEAFKTFIELTDDNVGCGAYDDGNDAPGGQIAAAAFDADLLALSPAHFGTAEARNYSYYSIVAMAFNAPPDKPYEPMDPIITGECPTAENPGTGYQALSILTGALRFPLCDTTSYDAVFQAIAAGVIAGAQVECEFPVPEPPPGETIDLDSVVVDYQPGKGASQSFAQVAGAAACAPASFYIEGGTIVLCPEACDLVQADDAAKISVLFACESGPAQ